MSEAEETTLSHQLLNAKGCVNEAINRADDGEHHLSLGSLRVAVAYIKEAITLVEKLHHDKTAAEALTKE